MATAGTLLVIGVLCLIAAIVGGNLKLGGAEFGALRSPFARVSLAIVGTVTIAVTVVAITVTPAPEPPSQSHTSSARQEYLNQLDALCIALINAVAQLPAPEQMTDPDRDALIILAQEFLTQWRRMPPPRGDEQLIGTVQALYESYLTLETQRIYAWEHRDSASVQALEPQIEHARVRYNDQIRAYGSNRCSAGR
jgi:hypothetical protein